MRAPRRVLERRRSTCMTFARPGLASQAERPVKTTRPGCEQPVRACGAVFLACIGARAASSGAGGPQFESDRAGPGAPQVQSRQPCSAQVPHDRATCFRNASRARNTRTPAVLRDSPFSTAKSSTAVPSTTMRRIASAYSGSSAPPAPEVPRAVRSGRPRVLRHVLGSARALDTLVEPPRVARWTHGADGRHPGQAPTRAWAKRTTRPSRASRRRTRRAGVPRTSRTDTDVVIGSRGAGRHPPRSACGLHFGRWHTACSTPPEPLERR